MKRIDTFEKLRLAAKSYAGTVISVAQAADRAVLEAVVAAKQEGLAESILVGNKELILKMLTELGVDSTQFRIVEAVNDEEAARKAVQLVSQGEAKALLKGLVPTSTLMREVLNKEYGLRSGKVMSHIMLAETASYPRFLFVTDGGMMTFPNLEQKIKILENAGDLLLSLGYDSINTAVLTASESVDSKNPDSVEAADIAAQKEHWQAWNMQVFGPVGLDLAISKEAVEHKSYKAAGAGEADIILVPDFQVGNCLGKSLSYFGQAETAGIIQGATAPIMLVSRADTAQVKLNSIALASVAANRAK